MTGLRLALLGHFTARVGHQPTVKFKTKRAQALLIYLATELGSGDVSSPREGLMELLWPGMPPKSARRSLRQTIYYLRQSIDDIPASQDLEPIRFLLTDRSCVQINPAYPMQVDVANLCQILDGPRSQWPAAVALYKGDFLADFYLPDSNPFEEWTAYRRADYRRMALDALDKLTADRLAHHEYEEAEEYALRQLVIDNLREPAYRQLMKLYAWNGRQSEALSLYQDCYEILRHELNSPPDEATTALYEAIKENRLPLPEEGKLAVETAAGKSAFPSSPYRGLLAFREEDAAYFFGREVYTDRLVKMVDRQPLVALIGPSGSGKSSVFHAGLLACLRQREAWQVMSFRPGNRPINALAAALLPLLEPGMTETERLVETVKLAQALRDEDLLLADIVSRIQQKGHVSHRFLLLADQFEELYAYELEQPERQRFVDLLLAFVTGQQNRRQPTSCFAFALRADFLDLVLGYRPFSDALQDSTLNLGPMTQEELTWAIEKPAKKQGVSFEHGLVERILTDLGQEPGNLPLLEFVLDSLWKRQSDRHLTHKAYNEIGRVEEALARHADEVYNDLEPGDQERARQIFLQLVSPGRRTSDTRRMSHRSELGEENWALAQDLADARLVVIDRDPTGSETVELVHETLIARWDRLQAWLDEDRAFRVWQDRMRLAVQQWEASDCDEGALLRGALLTEAERWLKDRKDQLSPAEISFVETGCALRDRRDRNRRRTTIALAAGLILTIALATLAIWQWRNARQANLAAVKERNQTQVTLSHLLATQAEYLLEEQIDLSLLLALEAVNMGESPETNGALLAALSHRPYSRSFLSDHQDQLRVVAISPDGRTLASGGLDNRIILRDLVSGQTRGSPLTGHSGNIRSLAFSPDGLTLASGSSDETVILWDLAAHQPALPSLTGHVGDIWSVDFSPGGALLASAAADGTIRLWDARTGQLIGDPIEAHNGPVDTIAFGPTGRLLASAGRDDTALVWDVSGLAGSVTSDAKAPVARQLGQPLEGHSGLNRALAFSPDGRILAMDGDDNTIQLWDISEAEAVADPESDPAGQHDIVISPILDPIAGHEDQINSLAFGADSGTLVSADASGQLIVWDLGMPVVSTSALTGYESRSLTGHGAPVWDMVVSQDGGTFVTAHGGGRITLWEMAGQHPLARQISGPGGSIRSVALNSDGQILAVGDSVGSLSLYDAGGDIDTFGHLIGQVQTGQARINSISFRTNENVLATAGGGDVMLWQAEPLRPEIWPELDQSHNSWYAKFSPDGRMLAVSRDDDRIHLWNMETGEIFQQLLTEDQVGVPQAFSQGGDWFVAAKVGGAALWDLEMIAKISFADGVPLPGTVPEQDFGKEFDLTSLGTWVWAIAVSPDGQTLATGYLDGRIDLHDVASGEPLLEPMSLHKDSVVELSFSEKGDTLVSIGLDGQIIFWNTAANSPNLGQPIAPPIAGPKLTMVNRAVVSFSPGGHKLAALKPDGSIMLWDVDVDSWRSLACWRAGRNLTQEEWRRFFGDEPYHVTCPDLPS